MGSEHRRSQVRYAHWSVLQRSCNSAVLDVRRAQRQKAVTSKCGQARESSSRRTREIVRDCTQRSEMGPWTCDDRFYRRGLSWPVDRFGRSLCRGEYVPTDKVDHLQPTDSVPGDWTQMN